MFEVLSTSGDNHLGGDDWDQRVIDWMADKFQQENGVDLRQDPMALQRLKEAAENAKKELSAAQQTTINLPFITMNQSGPLHLNYTLTRAEFEKITRDLLERCKQPVTNALRDAKLKLSDLTEVILVGGSTPYAPPSRSYVKTHDRQAAQHVREPPTRSLPTALPSRAACSPATSRASCCSTLPRCRWASRPWAAS